MLSIALRLTSDPDLRLPVLELESSIILRFDHDLAFHICIADLPVLYNAEKPVMYLVRPIVEHKHMK